MYDWGNGGFPYISTQKFSVLPHIKQKIPVPSSNPQFFANKFHALPLILRKIRIPPFFQKNIDSEFAPKFLNF